MNQSAFSPHTIMHLMSNYQANSQFHSAQNQLFFNGSPTNIHHDFLQYNRNASSHHKRQTQQVPFIPEFLNFNLDAQHINCGVRNGRTISNWSEQINSPNTSTSSQRLNSSYTASISQVQSRGNFRQNYESMKKQNWIEKLGKRNSFQDLSQQRESCNSSDSSSSSRSSTPNKHCKGSQAESSDDRDSIASIPDLKFKNKNVKQNKRRGNLYSSLSTGNLYQDQSELNNSKEMPSNIDVQNAQNSLNRRKIAGIKNSPRPQRLYKGNKFISNPVVDLHSSNIKYRNFSNSPDMFMQKFHIVKKPKDLLTGSIYDRLSESIWEKFEQNQMTKENFCHKMYFWKYLSFYIAMRFPYYGIYMVGSTLNGFGNNASDVDMCLVMKDHCIMDNRYEAIIRLEQIMAHLKKSDCIKGLQLIHAKVPILKVRDNVYDLDVDLNYNNSVGVRNTHLLYCYSRVDWRVKPLASVIKMWAQYQDINDPRNMTISSYSLILMVIHFLQCGVTPAVLPCLHDVFKDKFHPMSNVYDIEIHEDLKIPSHLLNPTNTQTLGKLLIEFFKYYSSFDYARYAISVRVAGRIPIERCRQVLSLKNDFHQWKYLCIEEPFEFTNTARSVYDPTVFEKIKRIINKTYHSLKKSNDLQSIFIKMETD